MIQGSTRIKRPHRSEEPLDLLQEGQRSPHVMQYVQAEDVVMLSLRKGNF